MQMSTMGTVEDTTPVPPEFGLQEARGLRAVLAETRPFDPTVQKFEAADKLLPPPSYFQVVDEKVKAERWLDRVRQKQELAKRLEVRDGILALRIVPNPKYL